MYRHYFVEMRRRVELEEGMLNMDMQPSRRSFRVIAECPITGVRTLFSVGCKVVFCSVAFGSVVWK